MSQPIWLERETAISFEDPRYLTEQLITYLGNKRALLDFIGAGVRRVQERLGKDKLSCFDVFSGSGVVARYLKQFSSVLYANDLETYSTIINQCYLTNREDFDHKAFAKVHAEITTILANDDLRRGIIADLYAPQRDNEIRPGERVFYTSRNARFLDTARQLIGYVAPEMQKYFLGPLLAQASVHANTSGVFKGFYKNSDTGVGQFGGKNRDALVRIVGDITLPKPVFSKFSCECHALNGDSGQLCEVLPEFDLAYVDPPYNQHPYGSNYFMLNLLVDYERPGEISQVSGIPHTWKRSAYNKARYASMVLEDLISRVKAKFVLISFNSEGFISLEEMTRMLEKYGRVEVLQTQYNTFRGSRNLSGRSIHTKEYLYLLER